MRFYIVSFKCWLPHMSTTKNAFYCKNCQEKVTLAAAANFTLLCASIFFTSKWKCCFGMWQRNSFNILKHMRLTHYKKSLSLQIRLRMQRRLYINLYDCIFIHSIFFPQIFCCYLASFEKNVFVVMWPRLEMPYSSFLCSGCLL